MAKQMIYRRGKGMVEVDVPDKPKQEEPKKKPRIWERRDITSDAGE